ASYPFNGVSPVLPLVLLSCGLYFWASAQRQRVSRRSLAEAFTGETAPYKKIGSGRFGPRLKAVAARVRHPVSCMTSSIRAVAALAVVVPVLLAVVRGINTVEHHTLGTYFLLSWALTQGIVALWV